MRAIFIGAFERLKDGDGDILPLPPSIRYAASNLILNTPRKVVSVHMTLNLRVVSDERDRASLDLRLGRLELRQYGGQVRRRLRNRVSRLFSRILPTAYVESAEYMLLTIVANIPC